MVGKVNNVIGLSQSPLGDEFFKCWFIFLRPLHHLTDREIDVIASFTKHRYELSKVIIDSSLYFDLLLQYPIDHHTTYYSGYKLPQAYPAHHSTLQGFSL